MLYVHPSCHTKRSETNFSEGAVRILGEICPRSDQDIAHIRVGGLRPHEASDEARRQHSEENPSSILVNADTDTDTQTDLPGASSSRQ